MYNRGDVLCIKGWATYATSVLREKRFSATSLEPLREDKSASVGPCLDESAAPLPQREDKSASVGLLPNLSNCVLPRREDKSASVGPCLDESTAPLPKKFQIYS